MNVKKALIWAGIGTFLVGAGLWIKYQIELSYKLIYGIANTTLKKVTPTEVAVEFDMTIENPTELKVGINGVDIDVYANGVKVTNIFSSVPVILDKESDVAIPLRMVLNPSELVQNIGALTSTGLNIDNVVLTMRGVLKIKKFGIPIPVPFIYKATYKEIMG